MVNSFLFSSTQHACSNFAHKLLNYFKCDLDCRDYFSASLFLVGEIGGNDFNYGFSVGKSMEEVRSYVPNVIGAIATATEVCNT